METQQNIQELIDPRAISKKNDPEGRNITAATIMQTRKEAKTTQENIKIADTKIQKGEEQSENLVQRYVETARALREDQKKLLVRLKRKIGIGDAGISSQEAHLQTLQQQEIKVDLETQQVRADQEELKTKLEHLPKGKEILKAYYEKMETVPLSNQEKRELLKPEILASLNEQEYIALWRRLNPYFLAHVTRQGFRDHNAMVYHSSGLEEFHDGFATVLQDEKKLRPPLALHGLKQRDEESVRKYIKPVLEAPDQKQAEERLQKLLNFTIAAAPRYPDETAVHFAAQIVADDFYGGERQNEVFFLYPSDVLASQQNFAFNAPGRWFTRPQDPGEQKWNDVFVWPSGLDNPGIPIDAGLVFLPENTPVDPKTGSKYASETKMVDGKQKRVMIEDSQLVETFLSQINGMDPQARLRSVFERYKATGNYYDQLREKESCLKVFEEELCKMGLSHDASNSLTPTLLNTLITFGFDNEAVFRETIMQSDARFKRAENAVQAKDYWENFFAKNPGFRPSHIHYYDGDPTVAVYDFQQKNGIGKADTSKTDGDLLGFNDHLVSNLHQDQRAYLGYYQLQDMANKIIADHFQSSTSSEH